jgi:hypothetical protein
MKYRIAVGAATLGILAATPLVLAVTASAAPSPGMVASV